MMTDDDFYSIYQDRVVAVLEQLANDLKASSRIARNDALRYVVLKLDLFPIFEYTLLVNMASRQFDLSYRDEQKKHHTIAAQTLDEFQNILNS